MTMTLAHPKAFSVLFKDLERWDVLSLWLRKTVKVSTPLVKIGDIFRVRQEAVPAMDLALGEVSMVDKVSFDGEIFAGQRQQTRMTQFLALPGDIIVSKIQARQGSVGLVSEKHGSVSVTIHYRVLVPNKEMVSPDYAWLAMRSGYARAQFLSVTGGAMKGEISEEALLKIPIPLPVRPVQETIVNNWRQAQSAAARSRECVASLEAEIPTTIYKSLGTARPKIEEPLPKLMVLWWKELERWSFNYLGRARQGLLGFTKSRYPIRPLGEYLLETMNGYCIKPVQTPTPHKMLKLSALTPGGLNTRESKFIKVSDRIAQRFHLRRNDLLICRSNAYEYVAKTALVDLDYPTILFPDIIIRARVAKGLLAEYAREIIECPLGRTYFQLNSRRAVGGMWKIGAQDIRSFSIPVPPLEIQRDIVAMINSQRARIAEERKAAEGLQVRAIRELEEMILGSNIVH